MEARGLPSLAPILRSVEHERKDFFAPDSDWASQEIMRAIRVKDAQQRPVDLIG